jgi:pheromone shutdown protein TraB
MDNLRIIGTSHIASQSVKEITKAIKEDKPDIIALELDKRRFISLMQGDPEKAQKPKIKDIGFNGFLFYSFGQFIQKKLGNKIGISPGSEMKTAALLAKENKIKIALIDRDIILTLKSLSKNITRREKWNFVKDFFKGIFGKPDKELLENLDLRKVPDDKLISKLLESVKDRYPGLFKSLVEERNLIMAVNIAKLLRQSPESNILVIVGAGHKEDLEEEIARRINREIFVAG